MLMTIPRVGEREELVALDRHAELAVELGALLALSGHALLTGASLSVLRGLL